MRPAAAGIRRPRTGFTLVEVMSVIAVIAILLGIVAVGLTTTGGTQARRAARGEVLGMLTRARSHAISSGSPTALAVVGLGDGPNRMRGKALGLYEVRRDEATGRYEATKQVRRWVMLPGRTILLGPEGESGDPKAVNVLGEPADLQVEVPPEKGNTKVAVLVHAVVFESTGSVSAPPGSGRLEFLIGEGSYGVQGLSVTAKNPDGTAKTDRVVLSRLSGRARSLSAKES